MVRHKKTPFYCCLNGQRLIVYAPVLLIFPRSFYPTSAWSPRPSHAIESIDNAHRITNFYWKRLNSFLLLSGSLSNSVDSWLLAERSDKLLSICCRDYWMQSLSWSSWSRQCNRKSTNWTGNIWTRWMVAITIVLWLWHLLKSSLWHIMV